MTLTASVLHDDGLVLLALVGDLDTAVTAVVQRTVEQVLLDAPVRVVVDLSGLAFCDSTGLGALVRTSRRVTETGGSCIVAGARGPVLRLLHLLSMERVLTLVDDVGRALDALRQDERRQDERRQG